VRFNDTNFKTTEKRCAEMCVCKGIRIVNTIKAFYTMESSYLYYWFIEYLSLCGVQLLCNKMCETLATMLFQLKNKRKLNSVNSCNAIVVILSKYK